MRIETIKKLCCPFDKSDLTLTIISHDNNDNIMKGVLLCSDCKRVYPIVSGIPIMSPDEYRDFKLEQPMLEKWANLSMSDQRKEFEIVEGRIRITE
ncbi:MAG: Trm112 family protein [Aequorivita sp.]